VAILGWDHGRRRLFGQSDSESRHDDKYGCGGKHEDNYFVCSGGDSAPGAVGTAYFPILQGMAHF